MKENYKREGEVKKFSQNPLAYLIRTCMHIYVLHNTSTKLSGKHGSTAKEKAKDHSYITSAKGQGGWVCGF